MSQFPSQRPNRRRRSRQSDLENRWADAKRPLSPTQRLFQRVRLLSFALFIVLAVLIGGLVVRTNRSVENSSPSTGALSASHTEARLPPESPEEKSAAAIALLDSFFKIRNPARRLPLVFNPANEQDAMLDYYGRRGRADPTGLHNRKVTALLEKGREILIVTFDDQDKRRWAAPVEWHTNSYRLHWGSMTGYGETSWDLFVARKPEASSRMRVNIYRPDSTATGLHPAGYEYVLLTHPELPQPLGALLGSSESLEPLRRTPANTDIPAYVVMQWQDFGPDGKWPVIASLIHRNWIR